MLNMCFVLESNPCNIVKLHSYGYSDRGFSRHRKAWLEINGSIEHTGNRGINVVTFDFDACQIFVRIL